jgi:hypothetical protein
VKPVTLREEDLPALYKTADANSLEAQQSFLKWSGGNLIAVLVAAAAGAFAIKMFSVDAAGVVALIAFIVAIRLRLYLLNQQPEKVWYDGRAGAESAKTLAWRYAVGGQPFNKAEVSEEEVDKTFIERMREIPADLDPRSFVRDPATSDEEITQGMKNLRAKSLDERRRAYRNARVKDQLDWYTRKAHWNDERAQRWNQALITIECVGAAFAVLKVVGWLPLDLFSLTAALVAAGASWLQTKQHRNLAEAYSVAATELSMIDELVSEATSEKAWANFVNEAEEAISREHTLWIASRTGRYNLQWDRKSER